MGFMQNETTVSDLVLKIYISANADAKVDVQIPLIPLKHFSIKADSVLIIDVPIDVEMYRSEVPLMQSIEINSDVPISVYAFSSQSFTTDAYSAIPVAHWGTEYVCISYTNDQYQIRSEISPEDSASQNEARQSEFMVIAAYDSTVIEFQPTSITQLGKQVFRTYNVMLNKGECYLVKSIRSQKGTSDLSGTIVRSTKPVGFLSGHVRTAVPFYLGYLYDSKNHLIEMLTPTESWGRRFVTIPLGPNPKGDMIRIAGIKPNTTVTYQSDYAGIKQVYLANPGSVATIMYVNEPTVWISDNPVQICQFLCHSGEADDTQMYDPSMTSIAPTEQYVSKILFQCPGDLLAKPPFPPQFSVHRVAIIADTASLATLKIDNISVNGKYFIQGNPIAGTPYCYGYFDLKPGKHELSSDRGSFSGVFYGMGLQDAYSMIIGSSLTNPFKRDTIPPQLDIKETCGKISGTASEVIDTNTSGLDFAIVDKKLTVNYKWAINPIADTATVMSFTAEPIDVTKDGVFVIDIRDKNGNGTRFRFDYHGINISLPAELKFNMVNADDSLCYTFYLKNYGKDSVPLASPYLTNDDPRLRYISSVNYPYLLRAGDSVKFTVCFDPRGDTSALYSEMLCGFDCNRLYKIKITGTVRVVSMLADGYDFGKVRVGDTVCAKVYIYNNGNSDIRIDSIQIPQPSKPFVINTAGLLPKVLKPGESLAIPACFYPDSTINYRITCKAFNGLSYGDEKAKIKTFDVMGRGSAPNVESLVIDWGRRRIGTRTDSTFSVVNSGTDTCNIKMSNLVCFLDVFNTASNLNFEQKLNVNDSRSLSFGFEPPDTIAYSAKAEYTVNWRFHKPVSIELKGMGSLPVIKTIDIDFGTVMYTKSKDSTAGIISSEGNEKLTIDSVKYFSGDPNVFFFDESIFKSLQIDFGKVYSQLITFKPDRLGAFETILEVTHDALPAYGRAKAYIRLKGFAITPDSLDATLALVGQGDIISCQTSRINAVLKNTGNISIELQKLELQATGIDAKWAQTNSLPSQFLPGETKSYPIDIFTTNLSNGILNVSATFNDTLIRTSNFKVIPKSMPVIVSKISNIKATPGDTVNLLVEGRFPNKIEIPINFKIILTVQQKNLLLTTKNCYFTILENTTKHKYSLTINQESDRIIIQTEQKLEIKGDSAEWSFELPFLVLLSDDLNPPLDVRIEPEDCYQPSEKAGDVYINSVCVYSMRNIRLIGEGSSYQISPNPVKDKLELKIFLTEENNISINIFDNVGKKCYNYKNIFLKKGKHSLELEIGNLAEGVYAMNIETSDGIKSLIFIISK